MLSQLMATNDPTRIVGLVDATADVISTDLSVPDIVALASEMVGMDAENDIYTAYVPSVPQDVDGVSYVVANWDALGEMVRVIDAGGDPSSLDVDQYGYVDEGPSATSAASEPTSAAAASSQSAESAASTPASVPKS